MMIFAIVIILLGISTVAYGGQLSGSGFNRSDPTMASMGVGGIIVIVLGICLLPYLHPYIKIAAIILGGVAASWYTFSVGMDTWLAVMGSVVIMGVAFWLATWFIK